MYAHHSLSMCMPRVLQALSCLLALHTHPGPTDCLSGVADTPFLSILFPDRPAFGVYLLSFLWLMALGGICLNLCYHGPGKVAMQVTSYIAMGWAAVLCMGDMWARLAVHPPALWLLLGGGVSYTVGVYWFVKDARSCGVPDHTIWHIFVLAGSMMHYFCIAWYLVPFPYGQVGPWVGESS